MMKKTISMIAIAACLPLAGGVFAKRKPLTPSNCRGAKRVNTRFVKKNLGKIPVYDVRKRAEYVEGHIPGAISAPYKEKSKKTRYFRARKDKLTMRSIPRNKRAGMIVHCNGPRCWKSYKSCVVLVRKGYKRVYWYRNGFPAWKRAGNPVE